ncbi:serine hydrolase [Nesterenkonia sphaerica]|uniref:Serine hydrolase n=1 Tax=Nesterenkonia sphaerica TaxID=1804988 RepID=A0A5R9A4Y1_9MICC|nr:serine hydrolase [Nesterenkonia sphaerica]
MPEPEPDPEPEPEPETPTPEPEPPAESSEVSFDGDLDAFLRQIASAYPGTISISLQEVGGQSRSASTGGADSFVTASTYKLLVGYSLIREVEAGELSWDDTAHGDKDLAQCFNDMIVLSDNPCPEAIGPAIGWSKIYADAAAVGATSTSGGEGGIRTNAADLTRFMTSLATGSMSMSEAGHERLRNALAANIHREGIPAGSAGRVLNKPGFINGNLHDTAIVHHPSGTYVLTILSQGSNWHALAGITRDIESALYG